MRISQMWPIGLGVLEDDGNGWVGKHGGRGFFHALADFARWTLRRLMEHEDVLRFIGIYDATWDFKDRFELANWEVMRAMIEYFWPSTNTFVAPNGELGFRLKDIKEVTGLRIWGNYMKSISLQKLSWQQSPRSSELYFFRFWAFMTI